MMLRFNLDGWDAHLVKDQKSGWLWQVLDDEGRPRIGGWVRGIDLDKAISEIRSDIKAKL